MSHSFDSLRKQITQLSANPHFVHHKWFVKWHLEIVEKLSLELCKVYSTADTDLVLGIVWMHDYAKIIDFANEHNPQTLRKGISLLRECGFTTDYIDKLLKNIDIFESKMTEDLSHAPIEVQIVSSADAASHMVGPFFSLFWYENPEKTVEELLEANIKKLHKDWDRKIVLPEVKQAFQTRYNHLLELSGSLPATYIQQ